MKFPLVNMSVGGLEPYFKQFLYFFETCFFDFLSLDDYLTLLSILDDYSMFF